MHVAQINIVLFRQFANRQTIPHAVNLCKYYDDILVSPYSPRHYSGSYHWDKESYLRLGSQVEQEIDQARKKTATGNSGLPKSGSPFYVFTTFFDE